MAKLSSKDLKESFEASLADVWSTWNVLFQGVNLDPFKDTDEIMGTDVDNDVLRIFYSNFNYAQALHDAFGWDLNDPTGPKAWSPRHSK